MILITVPRSGIHASRIDRIAYYLAHMLCVSALYYLQVLHCENKNKQPNGHMQLHNLK